ILTTRGRPLVGPHMHVWAQVGTAVESRSPIVGTIGRIVWRLPPATEGAANPPHRLRGGGNGAREPAERQRRRAARLQGGPADGGETEERQFDSAHERLPFVHPAPVGDLAIAALYGC